MGVIFENIGFLLLSLMFSTSIAGPALVVGSVRAELSTAGWSATCFRGCDLGAPPSLLSGAVYSAACLVTTFTVSKVRFLFVSSLLLSVVSSEGGGGQLQCSSLVQYMAMYVL